MNVIKLDRLLDPDDLDGLEQLCAFGTHPEPASYTSFDGRTEFAEVPETLRYVVPMVAEAGASAFDLPIDALQPSILRYGAGVGHGWHADSSGMYGESRFRTVSFSLLLNEPGRDFGGGDFESEYGPVDLHAGDAVVFTASTRHRVLPVTWGRRLVMVCFAEHGRSSAA